MMFVVLPLTETDSYTMRLAERGESTAGWGWWEERARDNDGAKGHSGLDLGVVKSRPAVVLHKAVLAAVPNKMRRLIQY